jgi:hypothetical protein
VGAGGPGTTDVGGRLITPGIRARLVRRPVKGRPGLVWAAGMSGQTCTPDLDVDAHWATPADPHDQSAAASGPPQPSPNGGREI